MNNQHEQAGKPSVTTRPTLARKMLDLITNNPNITDAQIRTWLDANIPNPAGKGGVTPDPALAREIARMSANNPLIPDAEYQARLDKNIPKPATEN